MHSDLVGFAGVAALVTIAPAADFALVSRRAIGDGARTAVITASGICSGVLVWGALSAAGIDALLAASASAYNLLRIAGGVYLMLLALQALRRARRAATGSPPDPARPGRRGAAAFRQGLLTNLLNPKVGVFYSAVLPQFVSRHDSVLLISLLFAAVHAGIGMIWYSMSAVGLSRGRRWFARPRARAALETLTAGVLMTLGVRVVTGSR